MLHPKPFYFLRHGQTDWNRERRCQGRTDVPLNAVGLDQAHAAKSLLNGAPITTVCCSPLGRARQTADIVNQELGRPLVIIDELQECAFGELEGNLLPDGDYEDWLLCADNWGGEPYEAFAERATAGINQALTHPGPVLIVSHGGIYRVIQNQAHLEIDGNIVNGKPVHLEPPGGAYLDWTAEAV
jgi:probable phosphoglycerate mutase